MKQPSVAFEPDPTPAWTAAGACLGALAWSDGTGRDDGRLTGTINALVSRMAAVRAHGALALSYWTAPGDRAGAIILHDGSALVLALDPDGTAHIDIAPRQLGLSVCLDGQKRSLRIAQPRRQDLKTVRSPYMPDRAITRWMTDGLAVNPPNRPGPDTRLPSWAGVQRWTEEAANQAIIRAKLLARMMIDHPAFDRIRDCDPVLALISGVPALGRVAQPFQIQARSGFSLDVDSQTQDLLTRLEAGIGAGLSTMIDPLSLVGWTCTPTGPRGRLVRMITIDDTACGASAHETLEAARVLPLALHAAGCRSTGPDGRAGDQIQP